MAGIGSYKKKAKGNRGYKMAGSPFPKKAGPEANRTAGSDNAQQDFEDREDAIEWAMNDNDLNDGEHPTEKQINKALRNIRAERKAGY